jgi:NADPH:quinone reductase-like Zn-dependent oxidoreductase
MTSIKTIQSPTGEELATPTSGKEATMKAALITEYGGTIEVSEVERPELPDDSVMVEVHAAAINPIDWIVMDGDMKDMLHYDFPWIVGFDVAGVVTELGASATKFSLGDRVFGRADNMQAGTMAEYCAVKESDLAVQADSVSHQQSAGVPLAGLTAWQALYDHGHLAVGQRVLIHAGSGGVGTLAIQFAKYTGAWVATTASANNRDLVMSLGADQFVDYAEEPFEKVVESCDLVFDMVGGDTLERSFDVVKPAGRVVSIKGDAPEGLADDKRVTFEQFFMSPNGDQLAQIAALIEAGTVQPIVDSEFPLDDVINAYGRARSGKANGKVIVAMR